MWVQEGRERVSGRRWEQEDQWEENERVSGR